MTDSEGYPTEKELRLIRNWDYQDIGGLLEFVENLWTYKGNWRYEGRWLHISTGGWSGNEDIIEALQQNTVFWLFCWYSSTRGGHFVFDLSRIPDIEDDEDEKDSSYVG